MPLMARTRCLIGNSSSAIREGAFIGTPAVNIGSRQTARERGQNVIDAGYAQAEILAAIRDRLKTGRLPSNPIYGDGHAGPRIAQILATATFNINKVITY
jgi:UDP-N-acetylglucosamine 2-epimerase